MDLNFTRSCTREAGALIKSSCLKLRNVVPLLNIAKPVNKIQQCYSILLLGKNQPQPPDLHSDFKAGAQRPLVKHHNHKNGKERIGDRISPVFSGAVCHWIFLLTLRVLRCILVQSPETLHPNSVEPIQRAKIEQMWTKRLKLRNKNDIRIAV